MIRNVPLTAVQAAVYKALSSNIRGYNVYDDSTPFEDGELVDSRYLVIGETTGKPSSAKRDCPVWEVTVNINAFSNYHGKKELDEMLDDIVQVLTGSAELEQIEIAVTIFMVWRLIWWKPSRKNMKMGLSGSMEWCAS